MTTKWEYWQVDYTPGTRLLESLGSDGWELVAKDPLGPYIFKRPKDAETQIAPEPEVSVTLTYSDMHFLSVKFSRWVYPKVETAFMPQFSRIEKKLKESLER